ncbi:hypothetical protein DFQ28_002402 [Apophysomyces sp. BC1034]|nr:hypothetical protein DFQ30_002788 [Apophysomyces sp. BC1015]KAG0179706.1 hypothetical protein DFQ29_001746 [Apophysomyces sp. BC1021]KAG0190183.1 hypothetical protein DFQ28_002402 [Apophysomyces sp. BC1034]
MPSSVSVPATTSEQSHEWLPMPRGILNDEDSFAGDLIRQFDKKRLRLRTELMGLEASDSESYSSSIRPTALGSRSIIPQISTKDRPLPEPEEDDDYDDDDRHDHGRGVSSRPQEQQQQQQQQQQQRQLSPAAAPPAAAAMEHRRRSAGELLRRSSAYLRAKFEALKHETSAVPIPVPDQHQRAFFRKSHPVSRGIHHPNDHDDADVFESISSLPPPAKIAINTTISIPQFSAATSMHYASVQPPVITQYPPKPLKYSPVEPSSSPLTSPQPAQTLPMPSSRPKHRVSLPLLNRHHNASERRRSDSDAIQSRFGSIGKKAKRWSKLLCKPGKKSKGKERAV